MQHIMCNTKNTHLLLKDFTYEQLLMRLVLMIFRCCATHPDRALSSPLSSGGSGLL